MHLFLVAMHLFLVVRHLLLEAMHLLLLSFFRSPKLLCSQPYVPHEGLLARTAGNFKESGEHSAVAFVLEVRFVQFP